MDVNLCHRDVLKDFDDPKRPHYRSQTLFGTSKSWMFSFLIETPTILGEFMKRIVFHHLPGFIQISQMMQYTYTGAAEKCLPMDNGWLSARERGKSVYTPVAVNTLR